MNSENRTSSPLSEPYVSNNSSEVKPSLDVTDAKSSAANANNAKPLPNIIRRKQKAVTVVNTGGSTQNKR